MLTNNQVSIISRAFTANNVDYIDPVYVVVLDLHTGKAGKHRGLYFISPEMNLYFGKASGANASIHARFQPHYSKLKVALKKFSQYIPKAAWSFPAGWREGIRRFILDPTSILPEPNSPNFDPTSFEPKFKNGINIDSMPVAIWDLSYLSPKQISDIEKHVLRGSLQPFCNTETHRARNAISS